MDFIHRLQRSNHFVWHNKLYHRKVLLSNFHLNGRTLGFHPDSKVKTTLCGVTYSTIGKHLLSIFPLSVDT